MPSVWPRRTARLSAALSLGLLAASAARAGDHRDTELLEVEAGFDIADVFAWTSLATAPMTSAELDAGSAPGERYVYLALTLRGRPVPGAQYVLHLDSRGRLDAQGTEQTALCTFGQALEVECWLGDDAYASGDASQGLDGVNLTVWTGFIDDPTYADTEKARDLLKALRASATSSVASGCPTLDRDEPGRLLDTLERGSANTFAGAPVFLLLLRARPDIAAPDGPLLGVHASTRLAP